MPKPNSVWYAGAWRSPEGVERKRQGNRERQQRYQATAAGMLAHLRHRASERGNR